MGKALVIVESPAKAKTINKYLGKDYIVKSSVGHIRDLPHLYLILLFQNTLDKSIFDILHISIVLIKIHYNYYLDKL